MAKPIFIIGVPKIVSLKNFHSFQKRLTNYFSEYYVLVYRANGEEPVFQAFYEKDFNEVKFNELKEIVQSNIGSD